MVHNINSTENGQKKQYKYRVFAEGKEVTHESMVLELAEILYEANKKAVGGKAYNGDPLPTWAEFYADPNKKRQIGGWMAASEAALGYL